MASPVHVELTRDLNHSRDEIANGILTPEAWSSFKGAGPIPGIKVATFSKRTDDVVGTVIDVENQDGSRHRETIVTWTPEEIGMRMDGFTGPLAALASHFDERMRFTPLGPGRVRVVRSFDLHPRSVFGTVALKMIAPLLLRAAAAHFDEIEAAPRA
jgi:hypothetical protein